MNYYMFVFLAIVLPFAFISIYKDIKTRKISNLITLSFVYLSFLIFTFFIYDYDIIYYMFLVAGILLAYFFYHKNLWGGADGKIFIGLTFLLLALGNYKLYIDFLLNLLIFYSISIIGLVIFKVSRKDQKRFFKKADYNMYIFQILIAFIFLKNIIKYFNVLGANYAALATLGAIVVFLFLIPLLKKYFERFNFNKKTSLNVILFLIFVFMSYYHLSILFIFAGVLILRIAIDFISTMTDNIKDDKGEKYYSPFSLYLFTASIFTMTSMTNLVDIIVRLVMLFR